MIDYKMISEGLKNNLLKESSSPEIAKSSPLIMPLLEKIYPESLVSQIASIQPISAPVGKVAATFAVYSGFKSSLENDIEIVADNSNLTLNQFYETSRVIGAEGHHDIAPYTDITFNTGNIGKILYSEKVEYEIEELDTSGTAPTPADLALIGLTPEDGPRVNTTRQATILLVSYINTLLPIPVGGNTINELGNAKVILSIQNKTAIKKYFKKYTGDFSGMINSANYVNTNDSNKDIKYVDLKTRAVTIETKSRKIASRMTNEKMLDFQVLYGEAYKDVVSKVLAAEIKTEIDMEVISFLKDIAKPMNDIHLTYSLGSSNSLSDITSDLVATIYMAVEDIVKSTKRNRTMFVLADATTAGYLKTNAFHIKASAEDDNPYRLGSIGPYPMFVDLYSSEHYVLVGYKFDSDTQGDAGLIYAPYLHEVMEFDDSDTMDKRLLTINRYGYCRHIQDTGTGVGDSDFFRIFNVNYVGQTPLTQPGTFDIVNLSKNLIKYI